MSFRVTFNSTNTKALLGISDCHLMHEREKGNLVFHKKGNAFLYEFSDIDQLMTMPLVQKIIYWYKDKHQFIGDNQPIETNTKKAIIELVSYVLLPLEQKFGNIEITYGFTSANLNRFVQKYAPDGTCPELDQHAGEELNLKNNLICNRNGVACDFYISDMLNDCRPIVAYIVENLEFDRLYYYGKNHPIHISFGKKNIRHFQVMNTSTKGRRIPGQKACAEKALKLVKEMFDGC